MHASRMVILLLTYYMYRRSTVTRSTVTRSTVTRATGRSTVRVSTTNYCVYLLLPVVEDRLDDEPRRLRLCGNDLNLSLPLPLPPPDLPFFLLLLVPKNVLLCVLPPKVNRRCSLLFRAGSISMTKLRRLPPWPRLPRFFWHSTSTSSSVAPSNFRALALLSLVSVYPSSRSALLHAVVLVVPLLHAADEISEKSFLEKCTSSSVSPSFFRALARLAVAVGGGGGGCGIFTVYGQH